MDQALLASERACLAHSVQGSQLHLGIVCLYKLWPIQGMRLTRHFLGLRQALLLPGPDGRVRHHRGSNETPLVGSGLQGLPPVMGHCPAEQLWTNPFSSQAAVSLSWEYPLPPPVSCFPRCRGGADPSLLEQEGPWRPLRPISQSCPATLPSGPVP